MKIAHLADIHLGFRAYRKTTDEGRNQREEDVTSAFTEATEMIRAIRPDLIVVAGDVFDRPVVSNTVMAEAIEEFRCLAIIAPTIVVSGNHDKPSKYWHGNPLEVIDEAMDVSVALESRWFVIDGVANVFCVPDHGKLSCPDWDMEKGFYRNGLPNILVIHSALQGQKENIDYAKYTGAVHIDSFDPACWDYIAAGDFHSFASLAPNAYYSGSLSAVPAGPWDQAGEPKGFVVFATDTGVATHHEVPGREVIDLPAFDAATGDIDILNLSLQGAVDDDRYKGKLVRQQVLNVTPAISSAINRDLVATLKRSALHFHLHEKPSVRAEYSAEGSEEAAELARTEGLVVMVGKHIDDVWEGEIGVDREAVRVAAVKLLEEE